MAPRTPAREGPPANKLPPASQLLPLEKLQDLIARSQSGDRDAYGEIFEVYVTPIYRFVACRVNSDTVEDLVSDCFVKAWENLRTYKERKGIPFSAWLFRIARNVIIDALRRQRPVAELSDQFADDNRWNDPRTETEQDLNGNAIRRALAKLADRDRDVLELAYFGELSTEEIAAAMRMSTGSVRIVKFRALRKLESLLPTGFAV